MREILFRGKRDDNGEWVYGYLVNATWYSDGSPMTMIVPTDTDVYPRSEIMYEEVLPETVGQWTGLVDKNGTKIFEGDLIKCSIIYDIGCYPHSKAEIREVKYIEGCFNPLYDCERNTYEVIGNIHDNPELLKMKGR